MLAASQALASLAVLSVGVIYGTDMFSALVLRPAMAALTDRELTQAAGRIHQYGDQRLPLPGAAGTIAAAAAAICAAFAGHAAAAALAGAAFVALLGWLGLYLRIAAPINHRMTSARLVARWATAASAREPPLGRQAQQRAGDRLARRTRLSRLAH
jgi:hypothetical protein